MTLDEVADTARNRLGWLPEELPRLRALVPGALKSIGKKVAYRSDRESLRSEINVNVVNGVITLNDSSILVQVLPETGLLVINGFTAKASPSYNDLTLKMPNDVYRWAMRGATKIHVKDIATGLLGTVNQAGTLTFNRVPTLADLPDSYDKELVDEVILLATKVERSPAPGATSGEEGLSVNLNAN